MMKSKSKVLALPGRPKCGEQQWPGVFLLGASGHMGRFFTQLLFHNPHSHNFFLDTRIELKILYITLNTQQSFNTQLLYD